MENETGKIETPNTTPRVRTYERDVEEFLKKEGGTAAKFALAEQSRRIAMVGTPTSDRSVGASGEQKVTKKNPPPGGGFSPSVPSPEVVRQTIHARSLVFWSVLFLALAGVVGVGYWYFVNLLPREAASVSVGEQKIVLTDTEKTIDATRLARETFLSQFARERSATLALSSFVRVVPTKTQNISGEAAQRALTTAEFLLLLEARADDEFVRALAPSFALGLRGLPQNRAFLVFKTSYYRTALAGMLRWEETLLRDLGSLLGTPAANASAPASAEALAGRAAGFVDRTLKNRDVRELLGEDGKPLILWGFADSRTLIITNDEDTFQKVAERLVATK